MPRYLDDGKKPTAGDRHVGARFLEAVARMMPSLRIVVLAGRHAQDTWPRYRKLPGGVKVPTVETWHPSKLAIGLRRSPPASGVYRERQEPLLAALLEARRLAQ